MPRKPSRLIIGLMFIFIVVSPLTVLFKLTPVYSVTVTSAWMNRYSYVTDYGNGTYTTRSYIGTRVFWNNQTEDWEELLIVNRTDYPQPHYLVRNSHISARIGLYDGEDAVLYYDPDMTRTVCAERWNIQAYQADAWQNGTKTFYNHTVTETANEINVTGLFRIWFDTTHIGWLQIRYVLRPACFLKHEVTYRSIIPQTRSYRAIMTLIGIAGKQLVHTHGTIILNQTQIEGQWNRLKFVNSTNPSFIFLNERLDGLGHYEMNETSGMEVWVNDYLKFVRLKEVSYWNKQLIRCDIVIGNYTLEENEQFVIDPDTDTWQVDSDADDRNVYEGDSSHPPWDALAAESQTAIRAGRWGSEWWGGFMRWDGLNIASGSTITAANFGKYCYDARGGSSDTRIWACEDSGSPSAPTTIAAYNAQDRTENTTDWDYDWVDPADEDEWHLSPSIVDEVQEVVDQYTITAFIIMHEDRDGGASVSPDDLAYQYYGSTTLCANLTITWTPPAVAPTYDAATIAHNTTIAGDPCEISCNWTSTVGLDTYAIEHNNTGTYQNITGSFGASTWSNDTITTLNTTTNLVISYKIYANDTSNNWNGTMPYQTFTITLGLPWSNGYEEGDFTAWSDTIETGANVSITSSPTHIGSYALNVSNLDDVNDRAYSDKWFGEDHDTMYLRAYARTDYVPPITQQIEFTYLSRRETGLAIAVSVYNQSSDKWGILAYTAGSWSYYWETGTTSFSIDTWYCIELYTYVHGSAGNVSLWVDGSQKVTQASLDTNDRGNISKFLVGSYVNEAYGQNMTMFFDSVTVDTSYIGCIVAEYTFEFTETITVIGDVETWRALYRSFGETAGSIDTLEYWRARQFGFGETATLVEDYWRLAGYSVTATQTITVTDAMTILRALFWTFTDTINVDWTHITTMELEFLFYQTITETVTGIESGVTYRAVRFTVLESPSSLADFAALGAYLRAFTQTVTSTDAFTGWRAALFQPSETISVSDVVITLMELLFVYVEQSETIQVISLMFATPYLITVFTLPLLEIVLMFCGSWFFSLIYWIKKNSTHGFIAAFFWIFTGALWLLINPVGITVALIFWGVGMFILIVALIALIGRVQMNRRGEDDTI